MFSSTTLKTLPHRITAAAKKVPTHLISNQKRHLNLHEFQSHALFRRYGIEVPRGSETNDADEALRIAKGFDGSDAVVKAQVLAGGRGKGKFTNGFEGGVHVTFDLEEVKNVASQMIGQTLVTKQTGARGRPCNLVYVQERLYARRETYFSVLLDRKSGCIVLLGSKRGGMNIEDVARDSPQDIFKVYIDVRKGIEAGVAEKLASDMGFAPQAVKQAADEIRKLYKLFVENDCTLLEINPMIETPEHRVVCVDAKVNIDDNADFRQKELFAMKDESQEDPRDVKAGKIGLQYIGLDGNIGCIVNGAGLAMATMDIIKLYGGEPANFLDVGGGATKEQIYEALQIINQDKRVRSILINVFGGIMRCDTIAQGLVEAVKEGGFNIPIILRLDGTNAEKGLQLVKESSLDRIILSKDLDDAARKSVLLSNITSAANKLGVDVSFSPSKRQQAQDEEQV